MTTILLIQPPFATIDIPSVGLGTMKAVLEEKGLETRVLYSNMLLASKIPHSMYKNINRSATASLYGEWIFSTNAYPSATRKHEEYVSNFSDKRVPAPTLGTHLPVSDFIEARNMIDDYLGCLVNTIIKEQPRIVGFSTLFQQTCSSVAIANRLKEIRPDIITVLGGGNCLHPMGKVLADISPSIDFIFSGEAEYEFLFFCKEILNNNYPEKRFIDCLIIDDLDSLPYPDYSDFFEQKMKYGIDISTNRICFESSRGCWWGERSHCLFCGLNGRYIRYREKSPERIKKEIIHLASTYNADHVHASDCIMPKNLPTTLFMEFIKPDRVKGIYYEVKPVFSFEELFILEKAGVNALQPGLESLNDRLLGIMKKGITAINNIRFLRDCRTLGIRPDWNILYNIPGETVEDYENMMKIIPYIFHLSPPSWLGPINVQRYSPLFNRSTEYGLRNVRPARAYSYIYPDEADIENLALYFDADYDTVFKEELRERFLSLINDWRSSWNDEPPVLRLINLDNDYYLVIDTRLGMTASFQIIDRNHFKILEKLHEPVPEGTIESFSCSEGLKKQFKELLDRNYIININNKLLSLLDEPWRVVQLEKSLNPEQGVDPGFTGL
ncbi:MAG: RiPP maturation radical SAM C-methyltransferase [Candidatus Odinarchaeota archaeon]